MKDVDAIQKRRLSRLIKKRRSMGEDPTEEELAEKKETEKTAKVAKKAKKKKVKEKES